MSTDRPDIPVPGSAPQPAADRPLVAPSAPQPGDGAGDGATGAGREVAGHARSEVEEVAGHAADQVRSVTETASSEIRDVVDEARDAVRQQADRQSHVAAEALGRVRDDLRAMARSEAPRESTADYIQRAAGSLDGVVERLERDGVEGALSGIRTFARRSPGGFLLASAGAGFALGRILRNGDHPQEVREQGSSADGRTRSAQGRDEDREIDLTGTRSQPGAVQDRALADRGVSR